MSKMQKLVTSNSEAAAAGENSLSELDMISMARPQLRGVDEDLFTPLSVPIGPYHHAKCSDRWANEKKRAADKIMEKADKIMGDGRGHQLMEEVGQLEVVARAAYRSLPETEMKSQRFSRMLLHDGCFVLCFFINYNKAGDPDSPRHNSQENTVMRDIMYLLENQIPMVVLDKIHKYLTGDPVPEDLRYRMRELLKVQLYISGAERSLPSKTCHLLQLVHNFLQPSVRRNEVHVKIDENHKTGRWRRVTEYCRYANVQVKRREFGVGVESILDVQLEGSTLWIPCLLIDSNTWTMLRNLMALEDQAGTDRSPVTAYCLFMSQLACAVEDIELLKRKKILEHFLGNDKEVAQGFANLCKKVILDVNDDESNYLNPMRRQLEQRCESLGHSCWGLFRDRHCGDSMRILAFVTAALLFVFQLVQVFLAGFSLRYQGK